MSLIWMDANQPEYYLSDNEIFLEDESGPKTVRKMLVTVFGVLIGIGILHKIFITYRV